MEELDPKYEKKIDGAFYRMPSEGKINDGVRIDEGADKWDLSRQNDGGILVEGETIRLKIWADKYLKDEDLYIEVEKNNADWSYEKAQNLGHWLNDKDWKNVEVTSILKFKRSPRDDPFVGILARSGIHDNRDDDELEGRPNACHAGSSYHSNIDGKGKTEEKIEFFHVDYGHAHNIVRTISNDGTGLLDEFENDLPKFGNIHNKKIGIKFCLYNSTDNGKKIVKSETYYDLKNEGAGPYIKGWETKYDGTEMCEKHENVGGDDNAPLMDWGGPYVILKSNDSKYVLYDLEIKEIVPPI